MKSAREIAFLNLIFIAINCIWLVIIDHRKVFGASIYETFYHNWSYLTPHINTFQIWRVIAICFVTTAIFYCILLKRGVEEDKIVAKQMNESGNWMILNQLLLGISIVLKVNDYLILAYIFTIGAYYTVNRLNYIFRIRDYKNPSIIHFLTRTTLGLYSGWIIYILGFNGLPTLGRLLKISMEHTFLFYFTLIFLICSFAFVMYKAIKCVLPAILFGYTIGVLGSYYYNIESNKNDLYHLIMQYVFISIILISCSTMLLLINKKRKAILTID